MKPEPAPPDREPSQEQQAYQAFYQQYAPKLWGIILLANLPISHSEVILTNALLRAWQQQDKHSLTSPYLLSYLIGLAHQMGLPVERVQAVLRSRLRPFSRKIPP